MSQENKDESVIDNLRADAVKSGNIFVVNSNVEPPLMLISRQQGTVDIKFDEAFLRTLALIKPEGQEAYSLLLEAAKSHGVGQEHFHKVLHDLLTATINSFHQDVYARAQAANPGAAMRAMQNDADAAEEHHVG